MFENSSIAVMYAVTPCHAGSGSALGVVDLPIQRERHTNWPMIQASGVKGAFRANFDRFKNNLSQESKGKINQIKTLSDSVFGTSEGNGYAGSLSVGDARILAYPMRSNVSPFVWITCPAVLKRLERDLKIAGLLKEDFSFADKLSIKDEDAINLGKEQLKESVLLEDYEVKVSKTENLPEEIKKYFNATDRLLIISDDVFNYGVSN